MENKISNFFPKKEKESQINHISSINGTNQASFSHNLKRIKLNSESLPKEGNGLITYQKPILNNGSFHIDSSHESSNGDNGKDDPIKNCDDLISLQSDEDENGHHSQEEEELNNKKASE